MESHSHSGPSAKVAIPRLRRPGADQQAASSSKPPRVRTETVNKACTRCRKRKTKCSGKRPQCSNCEKNGDVCVYEQPRRDRLREAMHKNDLLIAVLKDIRGSLGEDHAKTVDHVLQQFEHDTPPTTPSIPFRSMDNRHRSSSNEMDHDSQAPDETQVSASVGSNEDLDFLEEDLLADEGPSQTGFLGRNSQVQWMRTLQRKLDQPVGEPYDLPYAPPGDSESAFTKRADALHQRQMESRNTGSLSDYYFYLDHEEINLNHRVDPDALPPLETAKELLEFYRLAVHDPFRMLDDEFGAQLLEYYQIVQDGGILAVDAKWKAVLNLVLAIGARFSHLVNADWQADNRDHLVYMSRAVHFLGLNNITTFACAPDRLLIQATGLFSFYYLIIGHISRSWYMIGISIRYAQAAGLHLRNEDVTVPLIRKRAMAQTWWALHSIECILTSITGRPRVIERKDCTVPLLRFLTEEQPNKTTTAPTMFAPHKRPTTENASALGQMPAIPEPSPTAKSIESFLDAWTQLDLLQHKTLSNLYAARTAVRSWKHMQDEIASLITELDEWVIQALPHEASITISITELDLSREHLLLYFYYQSVKICVTRPCLCRLDRRIKGQSEESANFNRMAATACVQAALDLSSLLPEPADSRWLYERGPWWSIVHIIMQAITVLLLELAQGTSRSDPSQIAARVNKLSQWLETMKAVDGVAERAYGIVCKMLRRNDPYVQSDTFYRMSHQTMQASEDESAAATGLVTQAYPDTFPRYFGEPVWPPIVLNEEHHAQANEETFDMNPLAEPLSDPYGNPFQFGQEPYPFFYGNFSSVFDQSMNYGYDDDINQEDWSTMQVRQPPR